MKALRSARVIRVTGVVQWRQDTVLFAKAVENMCAQREKIKESIFGSYESVKVISVCYHDWEPKHAMIFGCIKVDARCVKCYTWWALETYNYFNGVDESNPI